MSKLYELSNSLIELELRIQDILVDESLSEEEREQLSAELLENYLDSEEDFIEKLDNCLRYITELESLAEARKNEAKRLTNLATQSSNRANDLRRYVLNHLERTGKTNIETANHRVLVKKKQPKVILDCESPEDLPDEFKRIKVEPDKVAIKKALQTENKSTASVISKYAHLGYDDNESINTLVIK